MLTFLLLAAVASPDGKTMAVDDWHTLAITGVASDANGPLYLQVHAGDLDGDGLPDDAVMKLVCAAGKLSNASYIVSPRDSATGQASGKRQHKPVTFVKEWGAVNETGGVSMRKDVEPHPEHKTDLPDFARANQYVWVATDDGAKEVAAVVKIFKDVMGK